MEAYILILVVCCFLKQTICLTHSRNAAPKGLKTLRMNPDALTTCVSSIHPDIAVYAVSGAVSGASRAVARLLSYPLDTLKTAEQAQAELHKERNLLRGVFIAMLSAIPANSAFILVFNTLNDFLPCMTAVGDPSVRLAQRIIISSIATLPANFFKIPAELLKQRAQLSNLTTSGLSSAAEMVEDMKLLGFQGLYQGGNAMLLREVPFNALQMAIFYYLKESVLGGPAVASLAAQYPIQYSGVLGLISAAIAALATQPADTIKTRLMKRDASQQTILSVSQTILREEGIQGFYLGTKSRVLLVSIGGLVYFTAISLTGGAASP